MFNLNDVDKEILVILKKVFLAKNIKPTQSDDHLRIWMIRMLFFLSVLFIVVKIVLSLSGKGIPDDYSTMASSPIAFFFGTLFLYINSESENTSVLVFILTWLSIVVALYMA